MPTAAKLFAALAFALLAFFAADIVKPHLPEGTQFGNFSFYCALVGLVAGWRVMGPAAGKGWWPSANAGVRTAAATVAIALLIFSIYQMLVLAFRRAYDGPMEAVVGIFSVGVDYFVHLLAWDVLAVLIIGGALAGMMSEWAARRWK